MQQHLEAAWREARDRFSTFRTFIESSEANAPRGELDYELELYSAWVLLSYAAHESAITSYGKAVVTLLSTLAATPDNLPTVLQESHLRRTLLYADELTNNRVRAEGVSAEDLLKQAYTTDWATNSVLMRLDRNAWPDNVRELLGRAGVADEDLRWMKEPYGTGTETLESQVRKLVFERNGIAHGNRPVSVSRADSMCEWLDAVREFSRRTVMALQLTLAESFPTAVIAPLGEIDAAATGLSEETQAFSVMLVSLAKGDHVLGRTPDGRMAVARVRSMMSDSRPLDDVSVGQQRVAVTFNRSVAGAEMFLAL